MALGHVEPDLPGYARNLLSQVVERTGYRVVIGEVKSLGYDSQLAMAGKAQPFHKLMYSSEYREFRQHFIVNAAVKILRVWDLPVEERLVPVTDARRQLPKEDEAELRLKLGNPPTAVLKDLSLFLYRGIVQQLTSMPGDIRVERGIAEQLAEHREAQRAYLTRQVRDLEPHFAPEIASVAPSRIYAASTGMNVVLAEEVAAIAQVEPGPLCSRTPYGGLGEHLRKQLHAVKEEGYRGDIMLTDTWAEMFGLNGWYEWRRLDDVR